MEVLFDTGSRVECKLERDSEEWFPGVIIQSNEDFLEHDGPPYMIEFDYGRVRPFWGPPGGIRISNTPQKVVKKELRFKVGDRVECSTQFGSLPGTVIRTNYCGEDNFENGYTAPYQVQLDTGQHVWAPIDADDAIRFSTVPPPECWICFDNEQTEDNLIIRECGCKGGTNGFVHVNCIVKLALSKMDFAKEPENEDYLPFAACITCRQPFGKGSHCMSALCKLFYITTVHLDISSTWNKMATTMMCELLTKNKDYDGAMNLIQERIAAIRLRLVEVKATNSTDEDRWLKDLSNFLLDLADVHGAAESFKEMEEAIEESFLVASQSYDRNRYRFIEYFVALASLAYKLGDKSSALKHVEFAIRILKRYVPVPAQHDVHYRQLCDLLVRASEVNIYFGKNNRGKRQLAEALEHVTRLYGSDHKNTKSVEDRMHELLNEAKAKAKTPYQAIQRSTSNDLSRGCQQHQLHVEGFGCSPGKIF